MSLADWAKNGWLRPYKSSKEEIILFQTKYFCILIQDQAGNKKIHLSYVEINIMSPNVDKFQKFEDELPFCPT